MLGLMPPVADYIYSLKGTEAKEWGPGTGTQCPELVNYYLEDYFGKYCRNGETGNGKEVYYKVPALYPSEFTKIEYKAGMKLLPGDILSLGSNSLPQYGHVVIVYDASYNSDGSTVVKYIEQWNGSKTVQSGAITISSTGKPSNYQVVYGVARPKNLK